MAAQMSLKLAWTVKPEKMQGGHEVFQLVALRTVNGQPVLNGDVVTRATSEFDNLQGQVVSMTMNDEGARQWSRITGQNIGKAIAIVLDDQVYSFPNVNSQIDGGRSQISGRFTVEEAGDLANVLESGKMVARVNVASESVIGPSLGKEVGHEHDVVLVLAKGGAPLALEHSDDPHGDIVDADDGPEHRRRDRID